MACMQMDGKKIITGSQHHTVKTLKIGTPKIIIVTVLKLKEFDFKMRPKDADRNNKSLQDLFAYRIARLSVPCPLHNKTLM